MNSIALNFVRFITLVLIQVVIFNNINFLGYVSPMPYILFLLVFPFSGNRSIFLLLAFLLGLSIDMFSNTGGMHAAACLCIAYARPTILKYSFGISYEYNTIKLSKVSFYERLIYIVIMVFTHHLVYFLLETFNIGRVLYTLQKTFVTGIFTVVLCLLFNILFTKRRK